MTEADLSLFIRQYARKAHRGHDPNDRGYCREVEKRVKRMPPEEVDRLIRGEEEGTLGTVAALLLRRSDLE